MGRKRKRGSGSGVLVMVWCGRGGGWRIGGLRDGFR